MGKNSKIEWCHHTFNPWVGCTKLSPACDHCYAEGWAKRTGQSHLWSGDRRRTSATNWQQPLMWNRSAFAAGERHRVFCGSLMDFADNQIPSRWRHDAWHRIDQCRHLDWMILSKRPENYPKMLPDLETGAPAWEAGWPHVWLGTTVEDRARKRRIEALRAVPAVVRFLSIEPLLEDIGDLDLAGIHLVIVGGERGPGARPMHPSWARDIREQCAAAGVPYHHKQNGEWAFERPQAGGDLGGDVRAGRVRIVHAAEHTDAELCRQSFYRGDIYMRRVGKARAGRLLDGVEHNGMPTTRAEPSHE